MLVIACDACALMVSYFYKTHFFPTSFLAAAHTSENEPSLDGPNHQSLKCSVNADNSRKPFRSSTWNGYYTNESQSRDSNRSATNAGSTRTKSCVFRGRYNRQPMLLIQIAATTLASDSAMTIARFHPSKGVILSSNCAHMEVFKPSFCRLRVLLHSCAWSSRAAYAMTADTLGCPSVMLNGYSATTTHKNTTQYDTWDSQPQAFQLA